MIVGGVGGLRMSFWQEFPIILVVVFIASVILGNLLAAAVLQMYPDIDPGELHERISFVLTCVNVLGLVWWVRRK